MMMSQNENDTKEGLLKKLKKQQLVLVIYGIIILLLCLLAGFNIYKEGFSFNSSLLPLCFLPMQVYLIQDVKKIKATLKNKF